MPINLSVGDYVLVVRTPLHVSSRPCPLLDEIFAIRNNQTWKGFVFSPNALLGIGQVKTQKETKGKEERWYHKGLKTGRKD